VGAFQELGLSADVVAGLDRLGFQRPTSIQRAAIPVLRRGSNAVIHAASGAGVTAAYGLPLADRLHELGLKNTVQALVVTPTDERASAIALELGQLGRAMDVRVSVLAPSWNRTATILVVPAQEVLPLMQTSALKLDDLAALVVHDVSVMLSLGQADALESLMQSVPRDAQRILISSEINSTVDKFVEAHARKALHVPSRPFVQDRHASAPTPSVYLEYRVLNGAAAREAVAHAVADSEKPVVVFSRHETDRASLDEELKLRGLQADTRLYGGAGSTGNAIGLGAPFDAESLSAAFSRGGRIVVEAKELHHLKQIAQQSQVGLRAVGEHDTTDRTGIAPFRDAIRRAMEEEDVEAALLVIEPLFSEFSAAEVAAAATALLRKRTVPAAAPASPVQRANAPASSAPPAFAKLFLSVGSKDTITAREIVGSITGEAGVSGDQIGKVEIRDTFSVVEVSADVAERVIRSLNGTSMRGRSLRVDYDRKPSTQRRPMPARRSGPPKQ
jgi:ATP-dependent RNA helicase DeaD